MSDVPGELNRKRSFSFGSGLWKTDQTIDQRRLAASLFPARTRFHVRSSLQQGARDDLWIFFFCWWKASRMLMLCLAWKIFREEPHNYTKYLSNPRQNITDTIIRSRPTPFSFVYSCCLKREKANIKTIHSRCGERRENDSYNFINRLACRWGI
jgi:hypothetical protein